MEEPKTQDSSVNLPNNPQVIFSWKAPLRAYKRRPKNVLRFYLALALLLSIIVFFFADRILIIPIWAILFLFYVLTITPPPEVENKITTFGIESAGVTARWELLSDFYFTKRFGFDILTIISHPPYYLHIYMIVPEEAMKEKIIHILAEHLIYQEKPQRTLSDKLIDWFAKLMPDDEEAPVASHQMQEPASL